jgi:hypothetical protein
MNAGGGGGGGSSMQNMPMQEKPSYAITSKLLRVVAVLIVQVKPCEMCLEAVFLVRLETGSK